MENDTSNLNHSTNYETHSYKPSGVYIYLFCNQMVCMQLIAN